MAGSQQSADVNGIDKTEVLAQIDRVDRQIRLLEAMVDVGPPQRPSLPLWDDFAPPKGVPAYRLVDPAEQIWHRQVHEYNAGVLALTHSDVEDPCEEGKSGLRPCTPPDASLSDAIKLKIMDCVKARSAKQRAIAKQYMDIRSKWIRKVNAQRGNSKESLERARFLLMVTRSAEMQGLAARTGSGRVTHKPVGSPASALSPQMPTMVPASSPAPSMPDPKAVASLQDVEVLLNEIEVAGGTAGGQERWGRNLASIPDQNSEFVRSAGVGSVLISDPLEEHYGSRAQNPWTQPERLTFLEKWLVHGKNFRKIASFIEGKTVYDIHRFYFQNKLRLGLKMLGRDVGSKRTARSTRRQALLNLSQDNSLAHSRTISCSEIPFAIPSNADGEDADEVDAGAPWTKNEECLLIQGLVRYGTDFSLTANLLPGRSTGQCRAFYIRERQFLRLHQYGPAPPIITKKKGKKGSNAQLKLTGSEWSSTELQEFSRNLKRFGRDWKKIAEYMPRRSIEELKGRWQVNRAGRNKPPLASCAATGSVALNSDRKRKPEQEILESKAAKTESLASPRSKQ